MQSNYRKILTEYETELNNWSDLCPIRIFRKSQKFSLDSFSRFFGVTKSAVRQWESGSKPSYISLTLLQKMISDYDSKMDDWYASKPVFDKNLI